MGHDISSYNKAGQEMGYIRFTMGDVNAPLFYTMLDANEYYAGVSGSGEVATMQSDQLKNALAACNNMKFKNSGNNKNKEFFMWQRSEMLKFINSCLETAEKEGTVKIFFG